MSATVYCGFGFCHVAPLQGTSWGKVVSLLRVQDGRVWDLL